MKAPTSPTWPRAVAMQIDAERAVRRMTVIELAERVGIHPGSMPRYMKGERKMTLDLVESFATALDIPLEVLFARAKERQGEA